MAACTFSLLPLMKVWIFFAAVLSIPLRTLTTCLTLSPPHLLHVSYIQETNVNVSLGQLVAQHIFNLGELKLRVTDHGDFFFLEFNRSRCSFEIKPGADFFGRVFYGILDFDQIGFTNGIEGGHGC